MRRHRFTTALLVLSMMVATPLVGLSGSASAVTKGSAGWCAAHPAKAKKLAACSAGGTGSGTGGPPPVMTVQVDPDPLVETGPSEVLGVIQVETSPSFAGDPVEISSSQLEASCGPDSLAFDDLQGPGGALSAFFTSENNIQVILDDDGNAMVDVFAVDCAPGTDLIEADLAVAPFDTALGTLVAAPPVVTPVGLTGYPSTSGTVTTGEVETGDTAASGDSDVFAVFYVETDPVYAEQPVEISSAQLESRCLGGWIWFGGDDGGPVGTGVNVGPRATTLIDDDGNAVFEFVGVSCAAGPSEVIADVEAGSHPTYTTTFTINPPAPTI